LEDYIARLLDFFGAIVGGIISSFAFIVLWEWFKRPKLQFETIGEDPSRNNSLGFYHIKVTNTGRTTAEHCRLSIEYKNNKLEPIKTLDPGKWDENPEPVNLSFHEGGSFFITVHW
jgi:hypothetical protein